MDQEIASEGSVIETFVAFDSEHAEYAAVVIDENLGLVVVGISSEDDPDGAVQSVILRSRTARAAVARALRRLEELEREADDRDTAKGGT